MKKKILNRTVIISIIIVLIELSILLISRIYINSNDLSSNQLSSLATGLQLLYILLPLTVVIVVFTDVFLYFKKKSSK